MTIIDRNAFLDHEQKLTIETIKGDSISFAITLNFSVGVYYQIICLIDKMQKEKDMILASKIVSIILHTSDSTIDQQWVLDNISIDSQYEILSIILPMLKTIMDEDYLKIPVIKVAEHPSQDNKANQERYRKKQDIARLQNYLNKLEQIDLMHDVVLVMKITNNSYSEVMNMPILIFKDIIKTVIISENRADDDYNLAYLQHEIDLHKEEIWNK